MKGNVIGFDPDTNTGAISGHDGNRYDFATVDWRGQGRPRHGDIVDFQAIGQRATDIYLLEPEYVAPSVGQFYFSFRGRISRSQYWLRFVVPYLVVAVVLQTAIALTEPGSGANVALTVIYGLFVLICIWPHLAVLVKRIHDRNKSGWLCLALYIPWILFSIALMAWLGAVLVAIAAGKSETAAVAVGGFMIVVGILGAISLGIGLWFFIEFGCLRGTIGANRFGPDPVR
ncbi:MAG: DUF805 domain-containing protein [Alphaproteobacteria bacterium]|nr:DUF805 domain-containing protein [Alphaproteobacteria bacterium]